MSFQECIPEQPLPKRAKGGSNLSLKYNKKLIQNAKELRKNQTLQERKLRYEFLSKYPVRFQRQKVIDNYIADFNCAKAKLVVEVGGNSHYECDQIEHDKIRDIALTQFGLKTIRFTNLEIAPKL